MGERDFPATNGVQYRLKSLEDWRAEIEKLQPPVMAYEIGQLREEVRSLKRAFYTFAFSTVGASIIFAFSVFALLGRHG